MFSNESDPLGGCNRSEWIIAEIDAYFEGLALFGGHQKIEETLDKVYSTERMTIYWKPKRFFAQKSVPYFSFQGLIDSPCIFLFMVGKLFMQYALCSFSHSYVCLYVFFIIFKEHILVYLLWVIISSFNCTI